ncbi:hypothetical protein TrVFT333_001913 [Trichoderma virens FT-333]|nr:hypothetical protein TrVFT333_001913 [Trichoderma virens FT-333]
MKIFPAGLLALACSLAAVVAQGGSPVPYKVQTPPLDTEWTYKVGTNPWPEHPRPQLQRDAWQSLNGIWTFQPAGPGDGDSGNPRMAHFRARFCFKIPHNWHGQNVILNFEAVDYQAVVFVNGARAGTHTGGYFRFGVDITKFVKFGGDNSVAVFVHDPTDLDLDVAAGMDGTVSVTVHSSNKQGVPAKVSVIGLDGRIIASQKGPSDEEFKFKVKQPKLWSPSSPTLYNLTVTLGDDEVSSYTGFRTISTGKVKGIQRPLLNGEFTFIFGTLDQGFWPDGLYTPPNREAMVYDLKMLKGLGFNAVRKHIKVEPDLFYRACDEMGLMVIQDMPSLTNDGNRPPNPDQQAEFQRQLEILINEHKSYPSIVTWVIYNEGWGQLKGPPYPEFQLVEVVRGIDSTRLIDATTGWNDHGAADYSDNHHYANPQCGTPFYSTPSSPYDPNRIGFQGEFGGIGHNVSIEHLWNVQQAINTINQTYEVNADLVSYNYRASVLFREFREQVERYACSGGIWTQTTDVEGEVNGLYTYDRRVLRPDPRQWISDINKLYSAAAGRR